METLAITGGNSPLKGAIPSYVPDQKWNEVKAKSPQTGLWLWSFERYSNCRLGEVIITVGKELVLKRKVWEVQEGSFPFLTYWDMEKTVNANCAPTFTHIHGYEWNKKAIPRDWKFISSSNLASCYVFHFLGSSVANVIEIYWKSSKGEVRFSRQ